MIDKKSLIQMANHVFRKSQGYPDRRLMHPQREWGIGLLLFAIIVIAGSVSAGSLFVKYRNLDGIVGDSGESVPQYRGVIVENALELHRVRAVTYKTLQSNKVPVVVGVASSTATSTESERVEEGG